MTPRYPALTDYIAGIAIGTACAILILCAYAYLVAIN